MGLIHPASEGAHPEDRPVIKEPEFVKEAGREFALLDWGLDVSKPGYQPEDEDEEDAEEVYEEKAPKMKYSGD